MRDTHKLTMMYQILNNLAPKYLRDHFEMSAIDNFYTLRNRKLCLVHSQKRASCNKLVDNLEQTCCQQADIRMRSHGLRQLVHNKSVASCQQT